MKLYLFFLALLVVNLLNAQRFDLRGTVTGESEMPLAGASVTALHTSKERLLTAKTQSDGTFVLNDIAKGTYLLRIRHLGYLPFEKRIEIKPETPDLGSLRLTPDTKTLGEVEIKAALPTVVQKGDTTEMNAGAFKVMKDASAEELLEKMPTLSNENGQIKAQGENMQQVLVDGKPFFGNDATAALRNLPAELIEKVQVYDAQSEQSQFTGFNDGNTVKTINLVTKTGMRNGQFGKVYTGYGYEDKYQAGGNISYFDGDRRLSLIGMGNNINVQNFAVEDVLGAVGGNAGGRGAGRRQGGGQRRGGQRSNEGSNGAASDFLVNASGGLNTTLATGLNYTDHLGLKTQIAASYFFNRGENDMQETLHRQFFNSGTPEEGYDENSLSHSTNLNHRFSMRLEHALDSANSIVWRPRLTVQQNEGDAQTLGATLLGPAPLNQSDNRYYSDLTGLNCSNALLFRHKFAKRGRTLSIEASGGTAPKTGDSRLLSRSDYFNRIPPSGDTLDQQGTLALGNWNAAANVEYTEPVGKNTQLMFLWRGSYQQESSDRQVSDLNGLTGRYDDLNETLSNLFSNDYWSHAGGIGYNYNIGRTLNISARLNAQRADLQNDQRFPEAGAFDKTFFNLLPVASLRYTLDKNRNLRFNYRSSTQLPSVEQLQNVVNNTNPLQLTAGNPDLKQAVQHNFFLRYQAARPEKSKTLFLMFGGGVSSDYIGSNTWLAGSDNPIFKDLNVQPGAQLTRPANLDGYWSLRSLCTYGFPLKKLKSNLNLDLSYQYARTPGMVNGVLNAANLHGFGTGITLSSNISEKVDFTLSLRPVWQQTRNTQPGFGDAAFLNSVSRAKFNWIVAKGFVLRTDVRHNLFSGFSDGFNQNFWLWNLGIGKKLFKNERGEITLAVNDLLQQNRSIARAVTELYAEDTQTNALTRFFMLSFTYDLRHFHTGKLAGMETQLGANQKSERKTQKASKKGKI